MALMQILLTNEQKAAVERIRSDRDFRTYTEILEAAHEKSMHVLRTATDENALYRAQGAANVLKRLIDIAKNEQDQSQPIAPQHAGFIG